jgi:hypothetical protein
MEFRMIRYSGAAKGRRNFISKSAPPPVVEKPDPSRILRGKRKPDDPNVKRKPRVSRPKLHPLPDKV